MPASAASSAPRFGKTLQFMQQLWELSHELQSLSKRMEASLGLTGPQRLALRIIGRHPGISAGELALALRIHPSTLTGVLRRLEERGEVRRVTDPSDARKVRLHLEASGVEADTETRPTVEAAVKRAMRRCAPADLEATKRVIATVIEELAREVAPD